MPFLNGQIQFPSRLPDHLQPGHGVQYIQPGHCSVGIRGCLSDYKAILLIWMKIPVRYIEAHYHWAVSGTDCKNMLKKSSDPHLALLNYRATYPLPWWKRNPVELLMGPVIRSRISCTIIMPDIVLLALYVFTSSTSRYQCEV